ncbi:MAG: hypothetical protein VW948_01750 [Burkholderiaceae bacterium]
MTEFRLGIFNFLKQQLYYSSFARTLVYTVGHIVIAMICAIIIMDTTITLSFVDAIVEPIINGIWYYVLDKTWSRKLYDNSRR